MTKEEMRAHCNAYGYSDGEVGAFYDGVETGRSDERAKVIDELKSNCIVHIQKQRPLTLTEIIHIIQFEADQMKYTNKNL